MLKYHIINLASCRLCPRRAAGGKERRYMDQNDKNKSNKNNDRRKGVLSLLIWALVLTIGFNYLLSAMDTRKLAESTCEIRYDEFLDLVRDGKVKEVEIADAHAQHHACGRLHLHRRGRQDLLRGLPALHHADQRPRAAVVPG